MAPTGSEQFTIYSLEFTVYNLQFRIYSLQLTVYNLQFTIYSLQPVYSKHYILYSTELQKGTTVRRVFVWNFSYFGIIKA